MTYIRCSYGFQGLHVLSYNFLMGNREPALGNIVFIYIMPIVYVMKMLSDYCLLHLFKFMPEYLGQEKYVCFRQHEVLK